MNMTDMNHLFMLPKIHDFKFYSLKEKSKIKSIIWLWKLKNLIKAQLKYLFQNSRKGKSLECHVQNIQKPQCVFDHLNYRTQPNIYERLFLCE